MNKYHYFLFGEEICDKYHEMEFSNFLAIALKMDFSFYCYNEACQSPEDLLEAYNGWNNYAKITESEFNQLQQLILKMNGN